MWTLEVQTRQRASFVDISREVAGSSLTPATAPSSSTCRTPPPASRSTRTPTRRCAPTSRWPSSGSCRATCRSRIAEGNSDAHTKASLMGSSVTVPVVAGALQLGTWQGIYFAEFDGPRRRRVLVTFLRA